MFYKILAYVDIIIFLRAIAFIQAFWGHYTAVQLRYTTLHSCSKSHTLVRRNKAPPWRSCWSWHQQQPATVANLRLDWHWLIHPEISSRTGRTGGLQLHHFPSSVARMKLSKDKTKEGELSPKLQEHHFEMNRVLWDVLRTHILL
jgi:hypothetical protein